MGNPRRSSIPIQTDGNVLPFDHHPPPQLTTTSLSFASLLRKPSALLLPFSLLLLFTWLFLRLPRPLISSSSHFSSSGSRERSQIGMDADANLARFSVNSLISRDRRGWLLDPIRISYDAGIRGFVPNCLMDP
ncbi:hypothetical protein HPP92_016276 [Vanilla planifolia]|uniref:Uncharacterized protein n=1 Tax=Vanilla planifolia TaxID=51239 RepID=A0A835UT71_VANPL|nr:hypothetical protein HPP92_016276 [Vanilla planifolia]